MGEKLVCNFVTIFYMVFGFVGTNVVLVVLVSNDFSWKVNTLILSGFEALWTILTIFVIREQIQNQVYEKYKCLTEHTKD